MYAISKDKYPENKEWEDKIFSTPAVPGGKNSLIENLRSLLLLIQAGEDLNEVPFVVVKHFCNTTA